jgi:hypothetical protein
VDVVNASVVAAVAALNPGNKGQVKGAVRTGVEPVKALVIIAAMRMAMAQWCAPCRRQHGGRLASSLAGITAASGPSQKNRIRKKERPRRIWNLWYTTSCFVRDLG